MPERVVVIVKVWMGYLSYGSGRWKALKTNSWGMRVQKIVRDFCG